jgi:fatty acid-binding protein DegV
MSRTAIVTDSTAYIPDDLCEKSNITVVPLSVIWGEETFSDGVTIKPTEFYTRQSDAFDFPSHSCGHAQGICRFAGAGI